MDPGRLILIQSINLFFPDNQLSHSRGVLGQRTSHPLCCIPLDHVIVVIDSVYAFVMTLLVLTIDILSRM